jgi:outer membrane protein OmpA-like peptidoglycan-associated protein
MKIKPMIFIGIFLASAASASEVRQLPVDLGYDEFVGGGKDVPFFSICDDCAGKKRLLPGDHATAFSVPLAVRFGPAAAPVPAPAKKVEMPPATAEKKTPCSGKRIVYFRLGHAELDAFEKDQLKEILPCLKEAGGKVVLSGYTCRLGSRDFNDRLARSRAASVAQFFEASGVRVKGQSGRGKTGYISEIDRLNRRVEIREEGEKF